MSDRRDFESLLMPLLDAAYGLAFSMTRNRADAEDLVQDAVVNALRAFGSFEPGSNFKAWFFRILTNRFHDAYRKRRVQREDCSLDDASELYILMHSKTLPREPGGADPGLSALRRIEADLVVSALQDLPAEFRETATLYFVEDFRYQELADMLDIPVGTVRSRLHRARRMLQKRLWQLAEDGGLTPTLSAAGGAA